MQAAIVERTPNSATAAQLHRFRSAEYCRANARNAAGAETLARGLRAATAVSDASCDTYEADAPDGSLDKDFFSCGEFATTVADECVIAAAADKEWDRLHASLQFDQTQDNSSLVESVSASSDLLHIWTLAHCLRRPILVYGPPAENDSRRGLFLPFLLQQSDVFRVPVCLLLHQSRFIALAQVLHSHFSRIQVAACSSIRRLGMTGMIGLIWHVGMIGSIWHVYIIGGEFGTVKAANTRFTLIERLGLCSGNTRWAAELWN
jgi:hypothetical protein